MAKHIIVKKKKTLKVGGLIGMVFTLAICLGFVGQVFLRTANQQTANAIQNLEAEIADVRGKNESLTADIHALRDASRVVAIAKDAGLNVSERTVTVKGE